SLRRYRDALLSHGEAATPGAIAAVWVHGGLLPVQDQGGVGRLDARGRDLRLKRAPAQAGGGVTEHRLQFDENGEGVFAEFAPVARVEHHGTPTAESPLCAPQKRA